MLLQECCGVLAIVQIISEMAALHLMIHFNSSNLNLHLTKGAIKCTHKTCIVHYFRKCQIEEGGTSPFADGELSFPAAHQEGARKDKQPQTQ